MHTGRLTRDIGVALRNAALKEEAIRGFSSMSTKR